MESSPSRLAEATRRAWGLQSFQILKRHDEVRLRAFLLSFDFDHRRAYFGGGVSDQSIGDYCATIDWDHTTVIAQSGPLQLKAVAILTSLPPAHTTVELSIACPSRDDHERLVADLLDLALDVAALRYWRLMVSREHASPDLMALLREHPAAQFGCETIEIDLALGSQRKTQIG